MAGSDPGMVIKVAADIADATAAFADVAGQAAATEAVIDAATDAAAVDQGAVTRAVDDTARAYADLGSQAPADLADVADAADDVEESADGVSMSVVAMGAAIGSMAADAIGSLTSLAFDAVQEVGKQLWEVIDAATGLSDAWDDVKTDLADVLRDSGVLQAGIDALGDSIQDAFGGNREDAVRTIATLINRAAIATLEFSADLITLGEYGARGIAALIMPVDAVLLALSFLGEKLADLNVFLADTATQIPGVGDKFQGLADSARAVQGTFKGWTEEARNTMAAHQDMVSGGGAFLAWTGEAKSAIRDAAAAMKEQQVAADAAAASSHDLADANAGLVEGSGAAAVALYNQNEQLAEMDKWSRAIKNTNPYAFLTQGLERTLPPLTAMNTELLHAGAVMKDTGKHAIDMSDDVKFAAEVVQRASVTWSEAMDLVRQGQGTMGGTIGAPTRPAGMSDSEWALMQSDPRQWERIHGFDWDAPHAGTAGAWNMGGGGTAAGTVVNQSVTVNTVAGDKQAIAAVVKDALASDWRASGVKG